MEAPGFGLTTIDGELSERTKVAAKCAKVFNSVHDFDKAHRIPSTNGIFVSRSSDLCLHAANQSEFLYAKGLYGVYRACFEESIPVRMVHADQFSKSTLAGLHVLYAPIAIGLSGGEQDLLRQFVDKGGTVIVEACPGLFDKTGILRRD
jgi:beta-galactosidase GanA